MSDASTDPRRPSSEFDGAESLNLEVYAMLRKIAANRMSQMAVGVTLQPTVLVHEAWLRMSATSEKWQDRNHFLATASVIMRRILIDNARKKASLRHGKGFAQTGNGSLSAIESPCVDEEILLIDEGVQELEKIEPLMAQVVIAKFFGGLTSKEIADSMGIGERSVERHWSSAKLWLYRWMQDMKRR
jgi:RNA polymerase sigma factor (TIGR02999 family)